MIATKYVGRNLPACGSPVTLSLDSPGKLSIWGALLPRSGGIVSHNINHCSNRGSVQLELLLDGAKEVRLHQAAGWYRAVVVPAHRLLLFEGRAQAEALVGQLANAQVGGFPPRWWFYWRLTDCFKDGEVLGSRSGTSKETRLMHLQLPLPQLGTGHGVWCQVQIKTSQSGEKQISHIVVCWIVKFSSWGEETDNLYKIGLIDSEKVPTLSLKRGILAPKVSKQIDEKPLWGYCKRRSESRIRSDRVRHRDVHSGFGALFSDMDIAECVKVEHIVPRWKRKKWCLTLDKSLSGYYIICFNLLFSQFLNRQPNEIL